MFLPISIQGISAIKTGDFRRCHGLIWRGFPVPGIQRGAHEILGHDGGPLGGRRCPRGGVDGVFFPVKKWAQLKKATLVGHLLPDTRETSRTAKKI